jgi:tetratricopeptide (TPR) repeat protein
MRKAGCECVQLGAESGSPRILKLLGKNITPEKIIQAADLVHQSGMQLSVFLITGIPEETESDQQQTINLIKRIRPHDLQVAPLAYYPGTKLFETALASQHIRADIFEISTAEAVLAQPDGQKQVDRLLTRTARYRSSSSSKDLLTIQQHSGFSAVTAMMIGDSYASTGNIKAAEAQYLQMTSLIPDHPWGWYLLGELYEQTRQNRKALACYEQLLKLVPHHSPALEGAKRLKTKKGG